MDRRHFILSALAATTLPLTAQAAEGTLDYTPGLVQELLDDGKTVFVDFAADWCSTCKVQERHIQALRANNPNYDANIVFVRVDWDQFGRSEITRSYSVPRRSTLIALKGETEIGRIIANTSQMQIKDLMDQALAAAMA